jgi:flagellar basal body-associated protein FliL
MKKGLIVLIVIVAVLAAIGVGIFFMIKGPDMKPLASYLPWSSSFYEVNDKGNYDTPPTISAQVKQAVDQDKAKYEAVIQKNDTRETQIVSQLKTAGITAGGAYIVDNDAGEQMLGLSIPFTGSILDSSSFINTAADSMVKLADLKTLDLTGLVYVNMFITDTEDRIIFGVTAKASDIQSYRAGKLTLEQFFAKTAAGVESRSGALDAMAGGLK